MNRTPRAEPIPVVCDLCEAPFELDPRVIVDGQALGLFTCSQCAEDNLACSEPNHFEEQRL